MSNTPKQPSGTTMPPGASSSKIQIHSDLSALVGQLGQHIAQLMRQKTAQNERFSFVLSGGSTPEPLYRYLSSQDVAQQVDWSLIDFFWGDERSVPHTDAESNFRMARELLLSRLPINDTQVFSVPTQLGPQEAATRYEKTLRDYFGRRPPRFDFNLMGLGDDGHTASLFPDTGAVNITRQWVIAYEVPKLGKWRISMTVPLLNQSHEIAFLVAGEEKADAVASVLQGTRQPDHLPGQAIQAEGDGVVRWWLDRAAAAKLV